MYMYVCVTLITLNYPEQTSLKPITPKNPTVNSRTSQSQICEEDALCCAAKNHRKPLV